MSAEILTTMSESGKYHELLFREKFSYICDILFRGNDHLLYANQNNYK